MASSIEMIKELRAKTGAGMMDCKKALAENDQDLDKAMTWLREKGIAAADKKASRITAEGVVDSYIHAGGRVGVLIEVNIETDFAAKNEEFRQMVRDLALQVAAMSPRWVGIDDVPAEELEKEKAIVRNQALNEGKPEKIVDKIVEGRLKKFYDENCLLQQSFIKDEDKTVDTLVKEMISKTGENISVRRFVRFELGEGLQKRNEDFAEEVAKQMK